MNTRPLDESHMVQLLIVMLLCLAPLLTYAQETTPAPIENPAASDSNPAPPPSSPVMLTEKYPQSGNASTFAVIVVPVVILLAGVGAALGYHKVLK